MIQHTLSEAELRHVDGGNPLGLQLLIGAAALATIGKVTYELTKDAYAAGRAAGEGLYDLTHDDDDVVVPGT